MAPARLMNTHHFRPSSAYGKVGMAADGMIGRSRVKDGYIAHGTSIPCSSLLLGNLVGGFAGMQQQRWEQ